jgi:hypothetical protein
MDREPPLSLQEDVKEKAPAFQFTVPGTSETVIPKRMSPFDVLRLAELGILRRKDSSVGRELKDAQSRSAEQKAYDTWEHYLQDLKPAWNGSRRLAIDIDVPGEGIESHRLDEDTSWGNKAETRLVCDLVKGAIETKVPAHGVPLTCANFLGVVVCGAQGGVITEKRFRFRINKPGKRVMVEQIRAVQGAEGDIVLLSFARNIPDKPFDVTLSRAKQSTVAIGNIRTWCQETIDENRLITASGKEAKLDHFGTYMQDIIEQKDVISYGDVQRFLNGEEIMEAEFPKLLMPKLDGTQSIERDSTRADPNDPFARLGQGLSNGDKAWKKEKDTRHKYSRNPNSLKKQQWFRDYGDRDGHDGGATGSSTAVDHVPAPPSMKDGKKGAPTFPSATEASASNIPRPMSAFEMLSQWDPFMSNVKQGGFDEHHAMQPLDQIAFYYDAQTSELRSKHGASTQVLPVGDIPDDLRFKELAIGQEYDKAFDTITKRYSGVDGLSKGEITHPKDKNWAIASKCPALISFDSEARAASGITQATHGPYFGQGLKPNKERNRKPWIKLEYVMSSQHPAIALVLQEEGQNDVTCYFYANSIQRDLENDKVNFQIHGNEKAGGRHGHIKEVADLRKSGELVQIDVYPWGPDKVITNDNGIQPARAVFTGITNARISELVQLADGNHPAEWEAMSARDKAIVFLHHSRHFSAFRYWPSGGAAPVNILREWMTTAMWATAKYGFHWFYQLQSNISIDATLFPLEDTNVPRWLARTMVIEFDRDGKLVTMRPGEWNQLSIGKQHIFPTAEAGAFALRLAIVRAGYANQL